MGKKARDPLAPKPPLNPYLLFSLDARPEVLSELGQISTTEIGKVIGGRWKMLKEDEKEKYAARFRENQEKYKIEKLKYEEENRVAPSEAFPHTSKQKKKKKKNPLAPKLPLSSYMEFSVFERDKVLADLGSLSLVDVGKELGRRWKNLSTFEKNVYEVKARENRVKYQKELEIFNSRPATDGSTSLTAGESTVSAEPSVSAGPTATTTGLQAATEEPPASESPVTATGPPTSTGSPAATAQPATGSRPVSTPSRAPETSSQPSSDYDEIKLEHLGFAKQAGFGWHPALKTGSIARGTRIKVTFFATGQGATIDKSKWIVLCNQSESKIKTDKLSKNATFRAGLEQMKDLRKQLLSESPVTSAGIGFDPQVGGRRFRTLNKDHLQAEEEENTRKMEKKMFQKDGGMLWSCRDCSWRGKYRHVAKSHARSCGQRKRINKRKPNVKKFNCSSDECTASFALRSQLLKHYR